MELYEESITKFSQILSQEPENAPAYCQLGAAYRLQDRLSNSITAYQKALTLKRQRMPTVQRTYIWP